MFQKRFKKLFLVLLILFSFLAFSKKGDAQMMGISSKSSDSPSIQIQQQEEQEGKKLLDDLGNKTISCLQLKDADFEKIGEYFMGQSIKDTSRHIAMNEMMKQMMGEKGEENMHISLGRQATGCTDSRKGGFANMMNWGYGNMMGNYGFGVLSIIFWIVILVDLVLLGVWLWKQINKK